MGRYKLIFCFLIIFFSCKKNAKISEQNSKNVITENKISQISSSDTTFLSKKSNVVDFVEKIINKRVIEVNDTIFFGKSKLRRVYGADKNNFSKYSGKIKDEFFRLIRLSKDLKTIKLTYKNCIVSNNKITNPILKNYRYIGEYEYLTDGRSKIIHSIYASNKTIIDLEKYQYVNKDNLSYNCKNDFNKNEKLLQAINILDKDVYLKKLYLNRNNSNIHKSLKEYYNTINLTKQNIDSINYEIVKKLFGELVIKNKKFKYSLTLLKKYSFKIQKNKDYVGLSFEECLPFIDQNVFDKKFTLKDSTEWSEEALLHKHLFYVEEDYVIVFDLLNFDLIKTLRECNKNQGFMIDYIRIFKKDIYIEKAKNSFSSFYSKKIP